MLLTDIVGHHVVPARHCDVSRRAAVPTVLCLTVLWASPSAHDTIHGPFTRAVPPMGHDHFRRVVLAHGPESQHPSRERGDRHR
jgi:hypothetical protein